MTLTPQQELGWFRSPIAAAMLSGVLAGAVSILTSRIVAKLISNREFEWIKFASLFGAYLQFCFFISAAAICRRDLKLLARAAATAIVVVIVYAITSGITTYLFKYLITGTKMSPLYMVWAFTQSLVISLLTAYFMARLFELRPIPKSMYGYCAVAVFLTTSGWIGAYAIRASSGNLMESQDFQVIQVMLRLIGSIILVVLPTIAIERALREQQAELTTISSNLAPLDAQPALDASSDTH